MAKWEFKPETEICAHCYIIADEDFNQYENCDDRYCYKIGVITKTVSYEKDDWEPQWFAWEAAINSYQEHTFPVKKLFSCSDVMLTHHTYRKLLGNNWLLAMVYRLIRMADKPYQAIVYISVTTPPFPTKNEWDKLKNKIGSDIFYSDTNEAAIAFETVTEAVMFKLSSIGDCEIHELENF